MWYVWWRERGSLLLSIQNFLVINTYAWRENWWNISVVIWFVVSHGTENLINLFICYESVPLPFSLRCSSFLICSRTPFLFSSTSCYGNGYGSLLLVLLFYTCSVRFINDSFDGWKWQPEKITATPQWSRFTWDNLFCFVEKKKYTHNAHAHTHPNSIINSIWIYSI